MPSFFHAARPRSIDPETPSGNAGSTSGPGGGRGGAGGSGGGQGDEGEDDGDGRGHGRGRGIGWLLGGCSASGPIGADPLSWLGFALVALVLRRRARK